MTLGVEGGHPSGFLWKICLHPQDSDIALSNTIGPWEFWLELFTTGEHGLWGMQRILTSNHDLWWRFWHILFCVSHLSPVVFLHWTLPSICYRTYIHTSKDHVTWIIKKVNRIPTHCGVAYESVRLLARGHVIRVCCVSIPRVCPSPPPHMHHVERRIRNRWIPCIPCIERFFVQKQTTRLGHCTCMYPLRELMNIFKRESHLHLKYLINKRSPAKPLCHADLSEWHLRM